MGKAPLRLVRARDEVMPGKVWIESLDCGHKVTAYQEFFWDDGAHLVNLEPSAIRRRCQECKAIAAQSDRSTLPPRKPVQSVTNPKRRRAA